MGCARLRVDFNFLMGETMQTSKIEYQGETYDMAAARQLMDDEICEKIHGTVDTDQEFFYAYVAEHKAKFGEDFVIN